LFGIISRFFASVLAPTETFRLTAFQPQMATDNGGLRGQEKSEKFRGLDITWHTMYNMGMKMYAVEFYQSERGENYVEDFLDGLQEKTRNKTLAWIRILQMHGPELKRPHADLLESPVHELRVSFSKDEVRILYFFAGDAIVLTHGFLKKTRDVPPGEIERARRIMSDWQRRNL